MPSVDTHPSPALIRDCVNTIRTLAIDATNAAGCGHPGAPMGLADVAFVLWTDVMQYHPADPAWAGRDRFVLSGGHASMLLYAMLHLTGYDLPLEEIKQFRQWGSMTPGHPEVGCAPGVEVTTGPLGSGFATAVGMALAAHMAEAKFATPEFNPVPGYIYGTMGDGDLMEGVSSEAASYAGHLGLGRLIFFYDANQISIDGSTDLSFTENVGKRFEAFDWHVQEIDGTDHDAIRLAARNAQAETDRPSLVIARTTIGFGSPGVGGTSKAHGNALGAEEAVRTKEVYGWPTDELFRVPDEVREYFAGLAPARLQRYDAWREQYGTWRAANPTLAELWDDAWNKQLPANLEKLVLDSVEGATGATRALGGKVIQAIAAAVPELVGGSADLTPSNNNTIADAPPIGTDRTLPPAERFRGRNFHFGVREFGMGCVVNGLNLYGCWRVFSATFLVFSDYMRPAIRLAAVMELPSLFVFTHDSIFVGEDGPTHQPIEHASALRAIPGLNVLRPADGVETAMCWAQALRDTSHPTCLLLTRQGVPALTRPDGFDPQSVLRGGYVLEDTAGTPDVVLVATGSEVGVAVEAAQALREDGTAVRVVSMPSVEWFEAQDDAYRESVIPAGVRCCAIEAGRTREWRGLVGAGGLVIGIDRFGASAPGPRVADEFGLSAPKATARIRAWLAAS